MDREQNPDGRLVQLRAWLGQLTPALGLQLASLRPASSDASFRRYFRIDAAGPVYASLVAMDAPPASEDCRPYVHVARLLAGQDVSTPQILAQDLDSGFLLLTDFGNTTYADALAQKDVDVSGLYADALDALIRLQHAQPGGTLPPYDRGRLVAEMRLFPDWYLARHLGLELTAAERQVLDAAFDELADAALAQGQVLVHRDYHCRNLMVLERQRDRPRDPHSAPGRRNPGVLDFQDAVVGPITYDLVSLLRDAYVEWPEDQQIDWAARYWEMARSAGLPVPARFDVFWRDFEWMGLQRALKVLGIFARLCHRDGKSRYLADLPLVLRHAQRVAERYDTFCGLARLLDRVHARTPQTGYRF